MATDNPITQEPVSLYDDLVDEAEPTEEPTEEAKDLTEGPETEESEEVEAQDTDESEEDGEPEDSEETDDEDSDLYLELDGEEVPLSQVKEWKQGYLRQSDYTKKTTDVANQRKANEKLAQELQQKQSGLDEIIGKLEPIIKLEEETLKDLRETDADEYLTRKEKLDSYKSELESAKSQKDEATKPDTQAEITRLAEIAGWIKEDGSVDAEKHKADVKLVTEYAEKNGVRNFASIADADVLLAFKKAALYDQVSQKAKEVKPKLRKAKITHKKSSSAKPKQRSAHEILYG